MSDKPTESLLLTWMERSIEIAPTSEPVPPNKLWRDGVVVKFSAGIPPAITDQPDDTTVLQGSTATFTVAATNAASYQWQKQESGAGAWSNVTGATSASYTTGALTVASDSTDRYRCVVTGPGGTTTSNAATVTVVIAPVNTVAPALSGTAVEGQILTCSTGTWTGTATITFAYQWQRNGSNISGATASTRTLTSDDVSQSVRCVVTATNAGGSVSANSNAVTPTAPSDPVAALAPMGLWYASDYSASPVPHVPNKMSAVARSASWYHLPRRSMGWNQVQNGGGTITDAAATAIDGTQSAFRLQVASSGAWRPFPITLPVGTYTYVLEVRSNTGSTQTFGVVHTAGTTSGLQATTSWQRVAVTFTNPTLQAAQLFISANAGALDLLIGNISLFPGSADLGEPNDAGHMYLGRTANDNVPTYASGELNFTGSQAMGWVSFASATAFTQFTACAVASQTATATGLHCYLGKARTNFADFNACFSAPAINFGPYLVFGSQRSFGQPQRNMYNLLNAGYHIFTVRYDGTKADYFYDDVLLFTQTYSAGTNTVQDYVVGVLDALTNSMGFRINSMALWNSALSNTTIRNTLLPALVSRATADGLSVTGLSTARIVVGEGDSITFGAEASNGSYASLFIPNSSPRAVGAQPATSGATLATLQSRAAAIDAILPPNLNGRKFILSVLIGTNELLNYSGGPSAYLTAVAAYCNARRAAGWLVAVGTVLPRADLTAPNNATFNANRATFNTGVRTWVGVNCDAVFDFAADATIGPDAAASNTGLYPDLLHPGNTAHAIMETIYRPVINAL